MLSPERIEKFKFFKKCVSIRTLETPIDQRIIKTDKDVLFYTGIKSKALFDKFFEYTKPLVKRKWRGPSVKGSIVRRFKNSPKKIGPKIEFFWERRIFIMFNEYKIWFVARGLG